jgi:hypothetical protein
MQTKESWKAFKKMKPAEIKEELNVDEIFYLVLRSSE